jgi:hypothetical protein
MSQHHDGDLTGLEAASAQLRGGVFAGGEGRMAVPGGAQVAPGQHRSPYFPPPPFPFFFPPHLALTTGLNS